MRRFFLKLIAILPLLAADVAFARSEQRISMESYCEISKRLYALSELELKARLATADQIPQDKKEVMARFDKLRTEYQGYRNKVYALFETSSGAFAAFARDNRDSIENYLEDHAAERTEIERWKSTIRALSDRIESRLAPANRGTNQ